MALQLRELMTKDVIKLPSSASIVDAAQRMREGHVGVVVVVEDGGRLCGVVTDRDIAVRVVAEGMGPATTPLSAVCSKELTVLSPDDAVDKAIEVMRAKAIRRTPVVDGENRVVGVVSLGDLAIERDAQSVLGHISAATPNL